MTEITTDAPADVYVNAEPAPEGGRQSLADALARVRRRTQLVVTERWLVIAGGILMPLGVVLVILGWYGASHTTRLFEEIPYMISGGLLGVVLVIVGGWCYFGYWLARMVENDREVLGALLRIEERLSAAVTVTADEGVSDTVPTLVATRTGTMYHRPDCAVVANRAPEDLRPVTTGEGMSPCRICSPAEL